MFSRLRFLIILLISSLTLGGCGDLFMTDVIKRELDTSRFQANCALDLDKFSEIMHENIGSQIRCLGENLNLFIRVVKSGKPGYLSKTQLEAYLAKHRPDVTPDMLKALKAVFDVGHLITGEDPNYISKETVDKVINFALVFNQEAALNFGPIFENESPVTYALHQNHRDRVSRANKAIIEALRTIYNPNRGGQVHRLNIIELMESFTTEATRPAIDKAKKVLFLKKVLFGGENEVISHNELEKVILNFDHLLLIGLDIIRYQYITLKQESILHLLERDVNQLFDIITQGPLGSRDYETLFTMDNAFEAMKLFIDPKDFEVDKFRRIMTEVKILVMKGNETEVTGRDLNTLFLDARALLRTGNVFHRIYDQFKVQLSSPRPVEETINFDEYRHNYPSHQAEYAHFERIAKKYRFMKGEFYSSYLTRGYRRNADAFFEIALLEYALKIVFSKYGRPSPNADAVGGFSMDQFQMQDLLVKFEDELIDLGLVMPGTVRNTADNISLLGTLFQYQSDKNEKLDVNEATEFATTLMSGMTIAKDLHKHMKKVGCEMDEFDRTDPECFKANYWTGLCTYYRNYFPLMFESFKVPKDCGGRDKRNSPNEIPSWVTDEMIYYVRKSADAGRTCNFYPDGEQEEIPYSEGDAMAVTLAIMHAETTILRWDKNLNNFMDPDEVEKSYEIYSPALDGFLVSKPFYIKALKKQIFQFMVKYEAVPDEKDFGKIWKFVKFLLTFNKKSPGYRRTIVAILDVIGQENKKIQTWPIFDCKYMRDPENIPREPFVRNKPTIETGLSSADISVLLKPLENLVGSYSEAGRADLKAELVLFSEDMAEGRVQKIKHVRQVELRKLFYRVARDSYLMRNVEAVVTDGNELHKVAFAVSTVLLD